MGRPLAIALLPLLLLAGPGPLLAPAAADIPPDWRPGTHFKTHTATVELGPWEGYTSRFVRVEPGNTVGSLALEHLGSTKRWKEILELNFVDPRALGVNTELRLPPLHAPLPPGTRSDPKRPEAREWWDFFVQQGIGGKLSHYRVAPEPSPWGIGMWLVAIRHDKATEILKRVNEDPLGVDAALQALAPTSSRWLARSDVLTRTVSVKDDDPVHGVETHWRVSDITGGKIELERVSERLLGRDGKELPKSSTPPPADSAGTSDGAGPPARWDLILTFLALLAAIGIAVVYAQRARRRPTGTSPSTPA